MKYLLYRIEHTTTYRYSAPVNLGQHVLHLKPKTTPRQFVTQHELRVDPHPASITQHKDYFGNHTHVLSLETVHSEFTVCAISEVAVGPAPLPDVEETQPWEAARALAAGDRSRPSLEATEFVYESPLIPVHAEFRSYAAASFTPRRPVLAAVLDLNRRIHKDFAFDPSATSVATPVAEVFRQRRGVCQDFAHFTIAALRSVGIPARYVSGYLETDPPPGMPKLVGADASHAWASFFCPGYGWLGLDPTNNCVPSLRHIVVATGRDFADVSPVRGTLVGSGSHTLTVGVDVRALGPVEDPRTGSPLASSRML
jgi:transglutaminase-like putative cysteine protease